MLIWKMCLIDMWTELNLAASSVFVRKQLALAITNVRQGDLPRSVKPDFFGR